MGSGLIHGGVALFLAVCVMAASKSYIYIVFYKLWYGIIVFSIFNGFVFLPIVLSLFGPVDKEVKATLKTQRQTEADAKIEPEDEKKEQDMDDIPVPKVSRKKKIIEQESED